MALDPEYQQTLEDAAVAYAEAIQAAETPADHMAAAQAIGNNIAIYPTEQGLVLATGLSLWLTKAGGKA
jgi:hypothetical protein